MRWFKIRCQVAALLRAMAQKVSPIVIPKRKYDAPKANELVMEIIQRKGGNRYLCTVHGTRVVVQVDERTLMTGDTLRYDLGPYPMVLPKASDA